MPLLCSGPTRTAHLGPAAIGRIPITGTSCIPSCSILRRSFLSLSDFWMHRCMYVNTMTGPDRCQCFFIFRQCVTGPFPPYTGPPVLVRARIDLDPLVHYTQSSYLEYQHDSKELCNVSPCQILKFAIVILQEVLFCLSHNRLKAWGAS